MVSGVDHSLDALYARLLAKAGGLQARDLRRMDRQRARAARALAPALPARRLFTQRELDEHKRWSERWERRLMPAGSARLDAMPEGSAVLEWMHDVQARARAAGIATEVEAVQAPMLDGLLVTVSAVPANS